MLYLLSSDFGWTDSPSFPYFDMAPSSRLQEHRNVLEVGGDASVTEIRRAYKRMALKWHPDRHHTNKEYASKRFVEVSNAYRALIRDAKRREERPPSTRSNPAEKENVPDANTQARCSPSLKSWFFGGDVRSHSSKRPRNDDHHTSSHASHNEKGSARTSRHAHFAFPHEQTVPSGSQRSYTPTVPSGSQRSYAQSTTDSHDSSRPPKKKLRKDLRPPTSRQNTNDSRSSARSDSSHPSASKDSLPYNILGCRGHGTTRLWTYPVYLSMEQLFYGEDLHIKITRRYLSGRKKHVVLDVHVPPGCRNGTQFLFRGAGHERSDGKFQDIVFLVQEEPNDTFDRDGDDLFMDVHLPWMDRLQHERGEARVRTIDGRELSFGIHYHKERLLSGIRVVRGAGMPRSDGSRGDMVVQWEIGQPPSSKWKSLKHMLHISRA